MAAAACARPTLTSLWLPLLASFGQAETDKPRSLSPAQRRGLASIIALTSEDHDGCDLDEIVAAADRAFSQEASDEERRAMWSIDEGIDISDVRNLRKRVLQRLERDDCSDRRERAAVAIANACLQGSSARFQLEASVADQFAEAFGATWCYVVGVAILALAAIGASSSIDRFVAEPLLGSRTERVPCACRICDGRLNLDDKVGEGGFGSVWRCKGEGVVVKLVRVDLERDVNALKGVLDEARHLLELRHDHVVAYYDTFVHRAVKGSPLIDDTSTIADFACIAMEDCEGGSLLDHVAASGVPFPLDVVVEVTRQCTTALAYAHSQGVTHRDVKLENIFVKSSEARCKLGDFGLAVKSAVHTPRRGRSHSFDDASSSSSVGGTEVYQPPECFEGNEDVFGAVDAWGLGCVLFEMATSQSLPTDPPFLGQLLLEDDRAKHSRAIADKFSAALAAAEHAAAQARDDDADSKASRSLCVAGLSSLLDGLLSAAPSERPLMRDVEKLQWLNAYRTTNLARFFRFVDFDDMKSERTERSRRARAFRAKSLPKTPDARRRHLQRRSPDSPAAAARQLEFEKRPRSSGRLW
uniref:non-specific serine/threonine protein kinase n=1 Tax=Pelagomonas calceolata TaxID=35677 RepID=A0A7S4A615_9STRA|mmetsp:Transcript_12826/g.37431  ORF Transcript_12826/g.37431 Transcript_12826/m.37431 type:complete len:584 (-) Transcript_12826:56-1807(-)